MITNIYGKTLTNIDDMRVEEKIESIEKAIPADLYKVLKRSGQNLVKLVLTMVRVIEDLKNLTITLNFL